MQRDLLDLVERQGVPARMSIHWQFRTDTDESFLWNPQVGLPADAVEVTVVAEVDGFRDVSDGG
jgi:hypothetical protein